MLSLVCSQIGLEGRDMSFKCMEQLHVGMLRYHEHHAVQIRSRLIGFCIGPSLRSFSE